MTSMREKIAEAIWQGEWARGGNGGKRRVPWSEVAPVDQDRYRFLADTVLDALMEPTKEMILGGNNAIDEHIDFWNYDSGSGYAVESAAAVACLQAMILAAKEGK